MIDWTKAGRRRADGAYCVYVITTTDQYPTKIGISDNIKRRFSGIQSSNWMSLLLVRHWWLVGKPLSERVEREAGARLKAAGKHIRGEWFGITSAEACSLVAGLIGEFGFSFKTEDQLEADEARKAQKFLNAVMKGKI